MRLDKDASPGGRGVTVVCMPCHDRKAKLTRFTLADGWADLDGPAFVAYVCADCANEEPYKHAPRTINGYTLAELDGGTYPNDGRSFERWEAALYARRNYKL